MTAIPHAPLALGIAVLAPFVWAAATLLSEPLAAWWLRLRALLMAIVVACLSLTVL